MRKIILAALVLVVSVGLVVFPLHTAGAGPSEREIHVVEQPPTKKADGASYWDVKELEGMGITPLRCTDIKSMVDNIVKELKPDDCIKKLYIYGHGSPGDISVGQGQGKDPERDKHIDDNSDKWKPELLRVWLEFCDDATIYLMGCNVGSCEKGRKKLYELSQYLGVTVTAPVYGVMSGENFDYINKGRPMQTATPDMKKPPPHKAAPTTKAPKKMPPVTTTDPPKDTRRHDTGEIDPEGPRHIDVTKVTKERRYVDWTNYFDWTIELAGEVRTGPTLYQIVLDSNNDLSDNDNRPEAGVFNGDLIYSVESYLDWVLRRFEYDAVSEIWDETPTEGTFSIEGNVVSLSIPTSEIGFVSGQGDLPSRVVAEVQDPETFETLFWDVAPDEGWTESLSSISD